MARPDFRAAAARRLSEEQEISPAIVSLLSPERAGRATGVRILPIERITPNPEQPRLAFEEEALQELAASIREHGVLQPILVRPLGNNQFQLVAGERRWRATKVAGLPTIPALVEELDDDTALEISIIENLQREDLSPLDEAAMYDRMITDHGYSVRKLAQKLGKDKGYLENRLRLADAPEDVRELVSLRKDTLSHAYELMKVTDEKRRRRLGEQVARGELTLAKLHEKVEGRRARRSVEATPIDEPTPVSPSDDRQPSEAELAGASEQAWTGRARPARVALGDDSLVNAKQQLADAVDELVGVLHGADVVRAIPDVDRANLAKYLTIAKLKLENAIALVRSSDSG